MPITIPITPALGQRQASQGAHGSSASLRFWLSERTCPQGERWKAIEEGRGHNPLVSKSTAVCTWTQHAYITHMHMGETDRRRETETEKQNLYKSLLLTTLILCPSTDKWINTLWYLEYYLAWKGNDGLPVYLTTWMNLQRITLGENRTKQNKKQNLGSIIWQCGKSLKPIQTDAHESLGMGEVSSLKGLWGTPQGEKMSVPWLTFYSVILSVHQKSENCMPKGLILCSVSIMPPNPWLKTKFHVV